MLCQTEHGVPGLKVEKNIQTTYRVAPHRRPLVSVRAVFVHMTGEEAQNP